MIHIENEGDPTHQVWRSVDEELSLTKLKHSERSYIPLQTTSGM